MEHSTPLINNLEIEKLFKDKNKEEKAGITDLINQLVQILKRELAQLRENMQELGELKLVKLQNKGQLSYITELKTYRIFKI